jgi:eukaryotic-like serine/threonine-protein kinase
MICPRCHRFYTGTESTCQYDGARLTAQTRIELLSSKHSRETGALLGDRYHVRGFIGKGGMARVYLAEDLKTSEPVAVKILEGAAAHNSIARERFVREAKAAAMIGHPNVVETRDVGQKKDGVPFIVMEYLYGESLGQYLTRAGSMTPDLALPVIEQVASALSAAHATPILHRDVKPDNIFLVGEPGEPYAVKVVDFGLAKLREGALTADGTVVGTVQYMAPEQTVTDPADARTDIYGLGAVAFKMFTGRIPFSGRTSEEILARQFLEPAPELLEILPGIDRRISALVRKALRKHPANRYASMKELVDDLGHILEDDRAPLVADRADVCEDAYVPRSPFAQTVAKVYRRILKLGET